MTDGGADAATNTELERISSAYVERDAATPGAYSYAWPGYHFYIQQLEWRLLEELRRRAVPYVDADVLEVGCGSGYFLHRFREFGARRAAGIDLMEHRIEQARERFPTLELVSGNAAALPWDDESFDLVTQFTCLSSVLQPELRARIASEMWRVLRPGGAIVSYDMRPTPVPFRMLAGLRRLRGADADAPGTTPTAPVTPGELRAWFRDPELTLRRTSLHFDLAGIARRGRPFASGLELLPFLRTHLIAVARKPPA
jgi:SAM-dependent methyltransferase